MTEVDFLNLDDIKFIEFRTWVVRMDVDCKIISRWIGWDDRLTTLYFKNSEDATAFRLAFKV